MEGGFLTGLKFGLSEIPQGTIPLKRLISEMLTKPS